MPPLPAIRALPSPAWSTIKLYGDESFSNFFRRLTFSPDGGLLLTPAGQFEDPSIITNKPKAEETPTRGRKSKLAITTSENNLSSASSVFIYSRANFARPPIAQLPGHKKASVAVKFSPVLYELRQDVIGAEGHYEPKTGTLEKGKDGSISVDIAGPSVTPATHKDVFTHSPKVEKNLLLHVEAPTPHVVAPEFVMPPSSLKPHTPSPSKPSTPAIAPPNTGSVFSLPYRMLYAVLTMDAVAIYDTQQSGPVCMLTKLHYDEFTDASWYVMAIYGCWYLY
jgi:chromatin assembly factor 1 subunit B